MELLEKERTLTELDCARITILLRRARRDKSTWSQDLPASKLRDFAMVVPPREVPQDVLSARRQPRRRFRLGPFPGRMELARSFDRRGGALARPRWRRERGRDRGGPVSTGVERRLFDVVAFAAIPAGDAGPGLRGRTASWHRSRPVHPPRNFCSDGQYSRRAV